MSHVRGPVRSSILMPIVVVMTLAGFAPTTVMAQADHMTNDVNDGEQHRAQHDTPATVHHVDEVDGSHHDENPLGTRLPLWSAIPFLGVLLSIAIFPLVAPHFWHHHFPKISALWALAFAVPFLFAYGSEALQSILHIYLIDYIPFIILLWALFTVSGGIFVGGSMRGTPRVNLALLLIGTLLASWIGTTGAAMVLIRPLLRANAWRRYKVHTVVFFIFLVANIGGSLTPLGDPPLFLGFLHGVPFFWVTTAILPHMLIVSILLLFIYYVLDSYIFRKEGDAPDDGVKVPLKIEGLHNLIFLLGVMAGVLFSGSVKMTHIPIYGHVHIELQNLLRDGFLVLMGFLSLRTTSRTIRQKNEFSWFPIQEVAYLFAGIFMTIIPALAILQVGDRGAMAGLIEFVKSPLHYFWVTGGLSSFLDNAPTYLTFFNSAIGKLADLKDLQAGSVTVPTFTEDYVGVVLSTATAKLALPLQGFVANLKAISAGAVFMGAMTYIGNAPNFMVKSIAEEAGVPMPSFFGFMIKYSLPFLVPVLVIVTFVFFV